jgi:hypothetical protein
MGPRVSEPTHVLSALRGAVSRAAGRVRRASERTDVRSALRGAVSRAAGRVRPDAGALLQQAVAATVAWIIASYLVDHREPFFAPIAAVIALNAAVGERGGNALRLLQGVIIGIVRRDPGMHCNGAGARGHAVGRRPGCGRRHPDRHRRR